MKKCPKFSNGGTPSLNAETSVSKLTPAQWKAKNEELGYVRVDVPRQGPYNIYRDPKKEYQTVVNDEVVDLPYITYSPPGLAVQPDPNHKPLQMGPNMNYNPNTGTYINPVTGKTIEPIIEQYSKGGKVKGYAYGGSPTFNNNIQGAVTAANTPQPTPTNGINKQQSLATGLVAANVGLNKLNGPQDTNMQYGTNDYFNNMNKTQAIQSGIANTASMLPGTAGIIGQGLKLQENVANIVDKKDAYGVSTGNQFQQTLGSYLRPGQAIGSIANDFKTGNVTGKTLAKAFLGGGILMNDENKVERAKLKYQSETDQNANQFKQDSAQQRASQESRVQNAIAAQNAGVENYQDSTYIPQAKLKQATMDDVQLSGYTKGWNNFNKKFANGGQVTGKGTAKSDSITAKVEEGSFIVPAINSNKAIELREMYLGGNPDKKADLKSGEVDVKLSNGEHKFSKEEVEILKSHGVDLDSLAPNAEHKDTMKNGGKAMKYTKVKGYAKGGEVAGDSDFVKKERAKIEAERKANAKKVGEEKAQAEADKKYNDLRYKIYTAKQEQMKAQKAAASDHAKALQEYNALLNSYNTFDKQANTALNYKPSEAEKMAGGSKPSPEEINKNREELLSKLQAAEAKVGDSKKQLDYSSSEDNFIGDMTGKRNTTAPMNYMQGGNKPVTQYEVPTKTDAQLATVPAQTPTKVNTPAVARTSAVAPVMAQFDPNAWAAKDAEGIVPPTAQVAPATEVAVENNVPLSKGVSAVTNPAVTSPTATTTPAATTPQAGNKFGWGDAFGAAMSYGLPLAQTIIGFNQLKKSGDRPVDNIDPDFLTNYNKSKADVVTADAQAKYGMSAEELAQLRMQNNALTNTGRFNARNISGGSAANALNAERSVINDAYGRDLQTKVLDRGIQRDKQNMALERQNMVNGITAQKQNYNRLLFGDQLTAFKEKQAAAAGLINAGLGNLTDSYFANKRTNAFDKGMNNSNPYNV